MGRRGAGGCHAELTASPAQAGATRRHWSEEVAERHLGALGWRVVARNYRVRGGELDLVCVEPNGTFVFVEVKQRSGSGHGGPAGAIDARKLARLRRTAAHYLAFGARPGRRPGDDAAGSEPRTRFDAVLVTGDRERHDTVHLRDVA